MIRSTKVILDYKDIEGAVKEFARARGLGLDFEAAKSSPNSEIFVSLEGSGHSLTATITQAVDYTLPKPK